MLTAPSADRDRVHRAARFGSDPGFVGSIAWEDISTLSS
ncbi:hypothetical protein NSERUTF1_5226 [Nocardia seriolae]|nr:hypothetical protein NSERUTF1_5226 [Nocardia seriolae]